MDPVTATSLTSKLRRKVCHQSSGALGNTSLPFRDLIAISQAEMAETYNATVGSARTPRAFALSESCWPASQSTTQVSSTTGFTAADPKANLLPTPVWSDHHEIGSAPRPGWGENAQRRSCHSAEVRPRMRWT